MAVTRSTDSTLDLIKARSRRVQAAEMVGSALMPRVVVSAGTRLNSDTVSPV